MCVNSDPSSKFLTVCARNAAVSKRTLENMRKHPEWTQQEAEAQARRVQLKHVGECATAHSAARAARKAAKTQDAGAAK